MFHHSFTQHLSLSSLLLAFTSCCVVASLIILVFLLLPYESLNVGLPVQMAPFYADFLCGFQIDRKIVRTEIGVLLRLSHPHIVSMLCVGRQWWGTV